MIKAYAMFKLSIEMDSRLALQLTLLVILLLA